MLPVNNAANSLGLGSKKYPKRNTSHQMLHTQQYLSFFYYFFVCKYEKQKNTLKGKNIYSKVSKQEKKYKNFGKF